MITYMTEKSGGGGGDRRLLRPRDGRMAAGVCAGLAVYLRLDVSLVRLAFGIFTVFYGLGILLYLIAWAVLPEEGEDRSLLRSFIGWFLSLAVALPPGRPVPYAESVRRQAGLAVALRPAPIV
ncbi:MAG TPA: PspC domain-containing protein [Trebonia sp.]